MAVVSDAGTPVRRQEGEVWFVITPCSSIDSFGSTNGGKLGHANNKIW